MLGPGPSDAAWMSSNALSHGNMPPVYRFAAVTVDVAAHRLSVDGRPRSCSRRALDLLVMLCEAEGRVVPRQELIERLWPGGQLVADESLTQAVFRARAALGEYAHLVMTVRGVGVRLDAAVERLDAADVRAAITGEPRSPSSTNAELVEPIAGTSAPDDATLTITNEPNLPGSPRFVERRRDGSRAAVAPSIEAANEHTAPQKPHARRWLIIGAVVVLVAIAAGFARGWWKPATPGAPAYLSPGYALTAGDLHHTRADSARTIAEAFTHDAEGDRARGRALLETVHDADPTTPVPAIFLGLWSVGAGDGVAADQWLAQARTRMQGINDTYLTALLRYTLAEREGKAQDILRFAGALLDLRPAAWQMRLARAHLLLGQGLRAAALTELRQIEIKDLSNRKLNLALADRASLGDIEGAQAMLDRVKPAEDDASYAFLRGRIAWSRGDFAASRRAYEQAAELGRRTARFDLVNRALANVGVLAMNAGERDAAMDYLEQARVGMVEMRWITDEIDLSLILADLHRQAGDLEAMRREIARARDVGARSAMPSMLAEIEIVGARLDPEQQPREMPQGLPTEAEPLLAARRAFSRGELDEARDQLASAVRRGALETPLDDEARLLMVQLGQVPSPARPVDPPYPPLARFTARQEIERLRAKAAAR